MLLRGIMYVKVSILGVLAVVKDLGSKEYQPRREKRKHKRVLMCGIMFVKVSILGVLAVVKDLGSKEYQPRRREEKKEGSTRRC